MMHINPLAFDIPDKVTENARVERQQCREVIARIGLKGAMLATCAVAAILTTQTV
jgi:hypothetical protein